MEEYEEDTNITSHQNQFIKNPHEKQGTGDTRRNTIPCGVSPIDNACVTANGGDTFKHGGGAVGSGGTRQANLNSRWRDSGFGLGNIVNSPRRSQAQPSHHNGGTRPGGEANLNS